MTLIPRKNMHATLRTSRNDGQDQAASRPGRSRGGPFQNVDRAGRTEPDDMCHADLRVRNLAVAGLPAKVRGHLEEVGHAGRAERMPLGQQAAGDIDGGPTGPPRGPAVDELPRAAWLAEPEIVVVKQLGRGKAVVECDEVKVLRPDARAGVGLVGGVAGKGIHVGPEDL